MTTPRQPTDDDQPLRDEFVHHAGREQPPADPAPVTIDALDNKSAANAAKAQFVFLLDGSESMKGDKMKASIAALTRTGSHLIAQGGKVETVFFGANQPFMVDLQDPFVRERAKDGLNAGSYLMSGVDALADILQKNQTAHVIVVGDGDLFDGDKVKPALEAVLRSFPDTTLDVVQIHEHRRRAAPSYPMQEFTKATTPPQTAEPSKMQAMVDALDIAGPQARPTTAHVFPEAVGTAVDGLLIKRLSETVPSAKVTPAPAPSSPPPSAPKNPAA